MFWYQNSWEIFLQGQSHLRANTGFLPTGHAQGCDCEVCASEFPLRTHPFLDMSYSRLNQDQKPSSTSKFSFFSRKKPSSHTPAHTAAALALAQEQRRASARVSTGGGSGGVALLARAMVRW